MKVVVAEVSEVVGGGAWAGVLPEVADTASVKMRKI